MSRPGSRRTGKMAPRSALIGGAAAFVAGILIVALLRPPESTGWLIGAMGALVAAGIVAGVVFGLVNQVAARITDLGHAVSKLGRGSAEVRVRLSGNDEVTGLSRSIQVLAGDLKALFDEMDRTHGASASMDPQVRELRDSTLGDELVQPDGFEVDGAIAPGSRGGMDYFGAIARTVFAVSAEGGNAISVFACRLARDEIVRALEAGADARKALVHANRTLHKRLPRGACAKASLIELDDGRARLFQAGYRAPLWICQAGETLELAGEGLALGLDSGPVFEKGLQPQEIPMPAGVRLVQTNESGARMQELLDLIGEHSPKHTAPFMNLVLGNLGGGDDGLREDVMLVTAKRGS